MRETRLLLNTDRSKVQVLPLTDQQTLFIQKSVQISMADFEGLINKVMGIPESCTIVVTSQREETRQCGLAVTSMVATLFIHRVLAFLGKKIIL